MRRRRLGGRKGACHYTFSRNSIPSSFAGGLVVQGWGILLLLEEGRRTPTYGIRGARFLLGLIADE